MNVRKVVKKVAALGVGATMLGATLFGAAAASLNQFPKPLFIDNDGKFDGLMVLGRQGQTIDAAGMNYIALALQAAAVKKVALPGGSQTVTVEGGVNLKSGTKQIYTSNAMNARRSTITKDDLSMLKDKIFDLDDGTTVEYEQTVLVGLAEYVYTKDSSAGLKNPEMVVQGKKDANAAQKYFYAYKVNFQKPVNFSSADVKGQRITLFGKEYTVSSKSGANDGIVLLGGSDDVTLSVGETQQVTVGSQTHTIELVGVASGGNKATIKVNGVAKQVEEGKTYTNLGGATIYVSDIAEFSGIENAGLIVVQFGADEMYFTNGDQVRKGTNKKTVTGTHVVVSQTGTNYQKVNGFTVYISAADNKEDKYIQLGESKTDEVFGALKLDYTALSSELEGSDRMKVEIDRAGDKTLEVTFTDRFGNTESVEFAQLTGSTLYLRDSANKKIHVYEGAEVEEDEYFFLNQGDYQRFMRITNINYATTPANSKLDFEDIFSGTTYTVDSWTQASTTSLNGTKVIDGTTYYIHVKSNGKVQFTVGTGATYGDVGDDIQVYQYMETISGKDFRVGFFDDLTFDIDDLATTDQSNKKLTLPTGTFNLHENVTLSNTTIGKITYEISFVNSTKVVTITPVVGTTEINTPSFFFIEDDDEANEKHVVVLPTTKDTQNKYVYAADPLFSNLKYGPVSFDNSDYKGYVDYFGTFVKTDNSDKNQMVATLWYPKEQMYGTFYIAPTGAKAVSTVDGKYSEVPVPIPASATVFDDQVQDPFSKNLIVVGGPCVNTVANKLMGSPAQCAAGFTMGKAKIKLFDSADGMNAGKVALLVAGYSGEDTLRAAKVLMEYKNYADKLVGKEVEVSGTSMTDITVSAPETQ